MHQKMIVAQLTISFSVIRIHGSSGPAFGHVGMDTRRINSCEAHFLDFH